MQLDAIAERLKVTKSKALGLLSAPEVRWCHRQVYDYYFSTFRKQAPPASDTFEGLSMVKPILYSPLCRCAIELAGMCPEDDEDGHDEFITLPCKHRVHVSCLKERLETGSLGFSTEGNSGELGTTAVIGASCPAMDMHGRAIT